MKKSLILFIQAFSLTLFGQEIQGKINFTHDNGFGYVMVTGKKINSPSDEVIQSFPDSTGSFKLKFEKSGQYEILIDGVFESDTTFIIQLKKEETLKININYPPKICPFEKTKLTGVCPMGNHKDSVIPIVYGLIMTITLEEETEAIKEERKEYLSGGCIVTDCDPNWYCKKHDKKF